MAKAATQDGKEATAQPATGSVRDGAAPAFNPLMANPAAAFAAATAIGFSFSTHMANAFFGALQGAMDAGQQFSALLEKQGGRDGAATPATTVDATAAAEAVVEPVAETPALPVRPKKAVPVKPAVRKTVAPAAKTAVAAEPVIAPVASPVARPGRGKGDDLKRISGLGPKLEQVLNGMGIRRFADVASWTEDEMRRVDAELGLDGRIGRDDWVGQAKALVAPKAGKK